MEDKEGQNVIRGEKVSYKNLQKCENERTIEKYKLTEKVKKLLRLKSKLMRTHIKCRRLGYL